MPLGFASRPSLVAYFTCGDPDLNTTREIVLAAINAGANIIELGVPFSDPVADGPVIQRASQRALQNGTTLSQVISLAKNIRQHSQAGLVIFSYLNPIMRMGLPKFAAAARDAGVDGVLITDLPVEEAVEYLREVRSRELAAIFLAAPTSTDERLKRIAQASSGFIYAISRTGITGTRERLSDDAENLVRRLRKYTDLPIAVGFGISSAEQFQCVGKFADAAVIGSAIVQIIEDHPGEEARSVAEFIKRLVARSD
jgi:tryptophan synthase alpha chain